MKRLFSLLLVMIVMATIFSGCGIAYRLLYDDAVESQETYVDPTVERKEKLNEIYEEIVDTSCDYISISYDHSSLVIDTNPNDSAFNDNEDEAILAIFYVNESLGFPSSLIDKMSSTRALDGMQSQSFEEYTVSWTYHPDNGLRVIYEVNI
ncbi:MAG: hypothetical protein IJO42_05030 [Clostridia bacterium]|nr:hypothetical protein [Clostridia bacterium]